MSQVEGDILVLWETRGWRERNEASGVTNFDREIAGNPSAIAKIRPFPVANAGLQSR